ncbi:MAG: hypothetical protein ABIG61_02270 [Planctomycetota bacterium]
MKKEVFKGIRLFFVCITLLICEPLYALDYECVPQIKHSKLPSKIVNGYASYWIDRDMIDRTVKDFLEPMSKAGFTACDFKIGPSDLDLSDPAQFERVQKLSNEVRNRGMELFTYVYGNPHMGKRDPQKHKHLPPFVKSDGEVVENKFSLIYWPTWRMMFNSAFQLAKVSRQLDIVAVGMDLETTINTGISYDDAAWNRFSVVHELDSNIPAKNRLTELEKKGLADEYTKWFKEQLEEVAKRYEQEMHAINPDLSLGIMPSVCNWFYDAFVKHLGTERAPAIIDSWLMYNGEGFGEAVLREQARIKALNPNNLYVIWGRIDSYSPADTTVQVYHAIRGTDGYCHYAMVMVNGEETPGYLLPPQYTAQEYYEAFKKAHVQVLLDIASGRKEPTIAYKPVTPMIPYFEKLKSLKLPNLAPAGTGEGTPKMLVMRNEQVVYIYAENGEKIDIELRHLAGRQRPISLHYVIIDKNSSILEEGTVLPDGTKMVSMGAPAAGTYALVVTGGYGGQAWYGVKVHNPHMGVKAGMWPSDGEANRDPEAGEIEMYAAYFFYMHALSPYKFWIARTDPEASARVEIRTGRDGVFSAQLNESSPVVSENRKVKFELPANKAVSVLSLERPEKIPEGMYLGVLWVGIGGAAEPYLFDGPERRVKTVSSAGAKR